MFKTIRILVGVVALAPILAAASLAVRDCQIAPFTYENCVWLQVRDWLGLPQSKFLRGLTLELVGLSLLAGLILTIRYVFPARRTQGFGPDASLTDKTKVTPNAPDSL
jgi:hypothetical protein